MSKVDKDEIYGHLSQFLKDKGIDLQEGAYTRTLQKGCAVLADTINLSQQAMERAKSQIEKNLDRAREVIHQKTAPRTPPVQPQPAAAAPDEGQPGKPPKILPRRRAAASRPRTPRKPPLS
jgi:hypothetical protein